MIVVTGANGKLGRRIAELLLDKLPVGEVGVSVRDPAQAVALADRGARVRQGDFSNPGSLVSAFEDAMQVLLVSSNARATGGDPLAQHRTAIDAAKTAGVQRIVYTSHMGVSPSSAFPPMRDHAATEAMLREAGIAWTALRHGFYASSLMMMVGDAATSGVLAAPQDGKVSWTAHRDLAAAAVAILTQEGRFDGPTPPLTASEALDLSDVASVLAEIHGRPVERQIITDDEQSSKMAARGIPANAIAVTLGLYRAARAGEFAAVDPTLATLIGRHPTTVREVLTIRRDE